MRTTYTYFTSNTEGLERHGDLSPIRVFSVNIAAMFGNFKLPLGMLDKDDLPAGYQSRSARVIPAESTPVLDLAQFFPNVETEGFHGELPVAAREYLKRVTGLYNSDVDELWQEITSGSYTENALENEEKTMTHWNADAYTTARSHQLLFGNQKRQRHYHQTRFLSKFIYDIDFKKYIKPEDGGKDNLLQQMVVMDERGDRDNEMLCFSSFLESANIKNVEIINPSLKSMAVKFSGVKDGKKTVYWVFKGTVASELPEYLVAYAKLMLAPESQVHDVVELMKNEPDAEHIVCGHSYGAWLADEVTLKANSKNVHAYLYNPPSSVAKRISGETAVVYQNGYRAVSTSNVFMQAHPDDPVTYPSLRTLFTLSAHSSLSARHDRKLLNITTSDLEQMYIRDENGLKTFPAFSILLDELNETDGSPKTEAIKTALHQYINGKTTLLENEGFLRYLQAYNHPIGWLEDEAQRIKNIYSDIEINVRENKPKPLGVLPGVMAVMSGLKHTLTLPHIRQWASGLDKQEWVTPPMA